MAWTFTDSTSVHVEVADNAALDLPNADWTLSAWVWWDSTGSGFDTIVGHDRFGASVYWWWGFDRSDNNLEFWADAGPSSFSETTTTDTSSIQDGWAHILVQRNGSNIVQYINGGSSYTSKAHSLGAVQSSNIARLGDEGKSSPAPRYPFKGHMADWAKWDRALTTAEIDALADGFAASHFQNSLVWYIPAIREYQELMVPLSLTNDSTTVATTHPPLIYPPAQIIGFPAAAASGSEVTTNLKSFTFTTYPATIANDSSVTTNLEAFTFTTYPATVDYGYNVTTNLEAFTFTTYPATIANDSEVTTNLESFTFTTYPASVDYGVNISTNLEAFTFSTYPATIANDSVVTTNLEAFTFSTYPASIQYGSDAEITTNLEAFTFTTYPATIANDSTVTTNLEAFTFTANPATIDYGYTINTNLEAFTFTTYPATVAGTASSAVDGYLPSIRATDSPAVKARKRNARYRYLKSTGAGS